MANAASHVFKPEPEAPEQTEQKTIPIPPLPERHTDYGYDEDLNADMSDHHRRMSGSGDD